MLPEEVGKVQVNITMRGPLKKYAKGCEPLILELKDSKHTVRDVAALLKIPSSSISFIQINGNKSDLDTILKGGETLVFNPRVAGG
jgi:molybdopterin converting factor small subunit